MQIQNKIPTSKDRAANTATAQALKQTVTNNKAQPGDLQKQLQDPKIAADVVKKTVDTTRGGVDVGTAVKSLAPDPDAAAEQDKMRMKKKMKKEHVFRTFRQYVEWKEAEF